MTGRPADEDVEAVQERLLSEAGALEKGLDFMDDDELREDSAAEVEMLREAASLIASLAAHVSAAVEGQAAAEELVDTADYEWVRRAKLAEKAQAAAEQRAADLAEKNSGLTHDFNVMLVRCSAAENKLTTLGFTIPIAAARAGEATEQHPCPKGDGCALNKGAVHCNHCGRNWPPDETWDAPAGEATEEKETAT